MEPFVVYFIIFLLFLSFVFHFFILCQFLDPIHPQLPFSHNLPSFLRPTSQFPRSIPNITSANNPTNELVTPVYEPAPSIL